MVDTKRIRPQRALAPILVAVVAVLLPFPVVDTVRRDIYASSAALYWTLDAFKFVFVPTAALIVLRAYGIRPAHYGLSPLATARLGEFIAVTLIAIACVTTAYLLGSYASIELLHLQMTSDFYDEITPRGPFRIIAMIYLALTAAICEEIFVRGLPLLYLQRALLAVPRTLYVLGTSGVFALLHWTAGAAQMTATFFFGIAAALFYLRARNLWPLIAAHFIFDLR